MSDPLVRALGAVNSAISSQDADRLAVSLNTVTLVKAMLPLLKPYLSGIEEADVETVRETLAEAETRISNSLLGWAEPPVDLTGIRGLERPSDWLRLAALGVEILECFGPADLLRKRSDRRVAVAGLEAILDLAPDAGLQDTVDTITAPRRRAA